MTTLTIHLPDNETDIVTKISDLVKKVKGSSIAIQSDDDGLTENELASLKRSLKEAGLIKNGKLKPLTMNDLWDE